MRRAHDAFGGADADPHGGLYVTPADAERLLAREPGAPTLGNDAPVDFAASAALARLGTLFDLTPFDRAAVAIAIAPEVDRRYERIYAYIQDDVTRRRPTVDLVLDLACRTAAEHVERGARFAPDAPLRRHALLRLVADPNDVDPPLLSHYVSVERAVVAWLAGRAVLDERLVPAAELVALSEPALPEAFRGATSGANAPIYLHGRPGSGRRAAAAALARAAGRGLLVVDVAHALDLDPRLEWLPAIAVRDAVFNDAVLLFENADALAGAERAEPRRRLERALQIAEPALFAGTSRRPPLELPALVSIPLAVPDADARAARWRAALARHDIEVDESTVSDLAESFRLGAGAIESAAHRAASTAQLADAPAGASALFAAATAESADRLGDLARRLEPRRSWRDLILPPDRIQQLRDICTVVRHRDLVYRRWGFGKRVVTGTGLTALFAGPSGTGKTLAAEVIAGELGLDAYVIDLSTVVSKYIGETEKNLARVFDAAESSNAILFFDEADALFGKRTEVRDSHDRYANVEVSYLLQRIESFDGIVFLSTNMRKNMDEAFVRRMQFMIDFPFPDAPDRRRIWSVVWPVETPLGHDLDLAELARRYELAGGNIRNIAVAAAFLAADDGKLVTMDHLLRATRREYGKLGKIVRESEFRA